MTDPASLSDFLAGIDIFSNFDRPELLALGAIAQRQTHKPGKTVFRQGDPSDDFRVVLSGVFEVYLWDDVFKLERPLTNLKRGDIFGEMGMLTDEARSAFVRAEQEGETLCFPKSAFFPLLQSHPRMLLVLARMLAHRLTAANKAGGIRLTHLTRFELTREIIQLLPLQVILRHQVLPVAKDNDQVTVAMVNPSDLVSRNTVAEFLSKYHVNWVCILQPDFDAFRNKRLFDFVASGVRAPLTSHPDLTYLVSNAAAVADAHSEGARILDLALHAAIDAAASDLHFEPGPHGVVVRGRIDGRLVELASSIPLNAYKPVVSRIKALSDLDITETRMPQESVLRLRYDERSIDLRISTVPTPKGESVACRLFDPLQRKLDFENLIVSKPVADLVRSLFFRPAGLILVTGPTGSGKTTTLYAGIRARQQHSPTHKVVTAEDPIEYELDGTTQVLVQPHIGLTYEKILRSLLHQDPNIILVGEIRDKTSMDIAMEAALTGHLVLASLHTNNAFETVMRLRQRGIEPYVIASALQGVVSQRLVPRLCSACAEPATADASQLDQLRASGLIGPDENPPLWKAPGCPHCRMTGRKGRIGLYEVLVKTEPLRDALERAATLHELQMAAPPSSYLPMQRYARHVLEKGLASPEDLIAQFAPTVAAKGQSIDV